MELRVMKNFLKIAETENITQASRELNVAQPHLTRQIKALEEELGVTLFVREKKRIHITEAGKFLRQQSDHILKLVEKTQNQIREMESGIKGTLFLGAIETLGTSKIPEWIAAFKKEFSDVRYNIWTSNSRDVTERLEKGLVDIAIVREPFEKEKFNSIHLQDERWIVFINPEHIFSQKTSPKISLRELSGEELIVPTQRIKEIENWFKEKNYKANITCSFAPISNAAALVQQNLGIAIVPESTKLSVSDKNIIIKELEEERTSGVCVIWRKDVELPGVAKSFLKLLSAYANSKK